MNFKKVISLILIAVCLVFMADTASAVCFDNQNDTRTKENEEFGFIYSEHVDSSGRIIRTYNKHENEHKRGLAKFLYSLFSGFRNDIDLEMTKAVLHNLGLGDSFIEELSDQELEDYARSNQITSIVTYAAPETENDNETNSNSRAAGNTMVDFGDGSGGGGGESEPEYDTYTANGSYSSYSRGYSVEFVLVVLELGGGRYRCSLNATYADMPEDKYWDGIGIAVQECAYDGNASAWLKYDYNEKVLGSVTETGTISYDHFETAAMVADSGVSGWCGRGLKYQLWEDRWVGAITKVEYLNLRLHLEFECVVVHPDSATNFQVYVSYEHIYEKTEYSPSFGFDNAGTPSYSFSYAVDEISDTYVFSLENAIAYTS